MELKAKISPRVRQLLRQPGGAQQLLRATSEALRDGSAKSRQVIIGGETFSVIPVNAEEAGAMADGED
ncbi:MAG: hypothetical protein ACREQT_00365 [Candidatus Binataceae bacterium]